MYMARQKYFFLFVWQLWKSFSAHFPVFYTFAKNIFQLTEFDASFEMFFSNVKIKQILKETVVASYSNGFSTFKMVSRVIF